MLCPHHKDLVFKIVLFIMDSVTTNFGTGNLSAGTILNCAFDVDNDKVFLGLNGTYYAADGGADGNPSSGTNPTVTTSFRFINK